MRCEYYEVDGMTTVNQRAMPHCVGLVRALWGVPSVGQAKKGKHRAVRADTGPYLLVIIAQFS